MSYRIIGDSCTDLPEELKKDKHFRLVPLTLLIDGEEIIDDETFDQKSFMEKVKASSKEPKSACPSPDDYMKEFDFDGDVYVVTLSSKLSGSHNSAELAKRLYLEENPGKNIEIFDSRSASVGQTLIAMKIKELAEQGLSFNSIVEKVYDFRNGMNTKFVLETLETLIKGGRIKGIHALLVNALNIKPIMKGTKEGTIAKLDQSRGIKRALKRMIEIIEKDVVKPSERIFAIAHCNNFKRAKYVCEEVLKRVPFKDHLIVDTAGVSTIYANEGWNNSCLLI